MLGLVGESEMVSILWGSKVFSKAASLAKWLEFIGGTFRLGTARDKAEGLLVQLMILVQVSDVTKDSLLDIITYIITVTRPHAEKTLNVIVEPL